jgi:putative transposase
MRLPLFQKDHDYIAFERVLAEGLDRLDAPKLLAYCIMPNHWHLVVHAGEKTNLSTWMQWVTVTHTHRWHTHYETTGQGPLYQGRFKSFPVQEDSHFLTVCRYVEANPTRAHLVDRAERWPWSSLWARRNGQSNLRRYLAPWPAERPHDWLTEVNQTLADEILSTIRHSAHHGRPLGAESWTNQVAERLRLETSLRPRGRPKAEKVSG